MVENVSGVIALLDSVTAPLILLHRDNIQKINNAARDLLGNHIAEGQRLERIVHHHSHHNLQRYTAALLKDDLLPIDLLLDIVQPDGSYRATRWHFRPVQEAPDGMVMATVELVTAPDVSPVVAYSGLGLYRTLPDGNILYISDPIVHMLGYDNASEIIEGNARQLYRNPVERQQHLDQLLQSHDPVSVEVELCRRDGRCIWVRDTMMLVRDANDQPLYIQGSLQDITASKYQAVRMEEEHLRFRRLAESLPDTVYIFDLDTQQPTYLNHNTFLGYDISDTSVFKGLLEHMHDDDRARVLHHWQNIDRRAHPVAFIEYRIRSAAGDWEWVRSRQIVLATTPDGEPTSLLVALTIITEQKEFEIALAEHNKELQVMNAITHLVVSKLELKTMIQVFLEEMQKIIPFDSASLYLVDDQKHIQFISTYNLPDTFNPESLEGIVLEKSFDRQILTNQQAMIIPDVHKNAEWARIPDTDQIRCWMGLPLIHQQKTIGMMALDHHQPNFFTQEHMERAFNTAQQVTIAIVNAQLYEQARSEIAQRQHMQDTLTRNLARTDGLYQVVRILFGAKDLQEVLPDVLAIIAQALGARQMLLITFEPTSGRVTHRVQHGIPSSQDIWSDFRAIIGETTSGGLMPDEDLRWPSGQTVTLPDGREALAGVVDRRGVLAAIDPITSFTAEEHYALVTLANQISIAVRNEILSERLHRYTVQLENEVDRRTNELRLEQNRLQALLDATGEGIFYMEDFVFVYANPAFCRMMGYDREALAGQSLSFIQMPPEDEPADTMPLDQRVRRRWNGKILRTQARLRREDETMLEASLTFTLIGMPNESPLRMVAVVRDISEEVALERQRTRFINNAAHELRTPLTSLGLRLHMMRKKPDQYEKHLANLETIFERLNLMVEELLDLTRFDKGTVVLERQPIVVQDMITSVLQKLDDLLVAWELRVETHLPNKPIVIPADGKRLIQAITHVMNNAINYSSTGNRIILALDMDREDGQGYARITVTDHGEGIEPDLLPTGVFQPFARPRLGNQFETGMGLALARQIVLLHGGDVHAASVFGEGSTLTLRLPLTTSVEAR